MPAETSLAALIKARASVAQMEVLSAAKEVAARLQTPLYLVGGAVRDLLATGELRDFDLVVEGNGIELARQVAEQIEGRFRAHDRFLTAEVGNDEFRADIVTARTEKYDQPAALPSVTAADMETDLARRDFTVNSMAYRLWPAEPPVLLDPYFGQRDLEEGWLRVLHQRSFVDDPTRILRGVRLGSRLGLAMEPETLKLAKEAIVSGAFEPLSAHRLRNELVLLLSEPDVEESLRRLEDMGFFGLLGSEDRLDSQRWNDVNRLVKQRETMIDSPTPVRWWLTIVMALMLEAPLSSRRRAARRLGLDDELERTLVEAPERLERAVSLLSEATVEAHRVRRVLDALSTEEIALLGAVATGQVQTRLDEWTATLRHIDLSIDGTDLVEAGFPPGPEFGRALESTLDARLDGVIDESQELEFAVGELEKGSPGRSAE